MRRRTITADDVRRNGACASELQAFRRWARGQTLTVDQAARAVHRRRQWNLWVCGLLWPSLSDREFAELQELEVLSQPECRFFMRMLLKHGLPR